MLLPFVQELSNRWIGLLLKNSVFAVFNRFVGIVISPCFFKVTGLDIICLGLRSLRPVTGGDSKKLTLKKLVHKYTVYIYIYI